VSALLFAALGGTWRQPRITLAANHLFTIVLAREDLETWFNDTTTETEYQMESGLFLDVVIRQGAAVFELLAGKDEALLIRRNAYISECVNDV
jgi:hypothetical protein